MPSKMMKEIREKRNRDMSRGKKNCTIKNEKKSVQQETYRKRNNNNNKGNTKRKQRSKKDTLKETKTDCAS